MEGWIARTNQRNTNRENQIGKREAWKKKDRKKGRNRVREGEEVEGREGGKGKKELGEHVTT